MDNISLQDFEVRYAAAWCSQDPASIAACYGLTGSLTINGGTPAVGRDAIAEVARSFMTAFPDMRVIMDELREQGDATEFHWTLIGTNTGPGAPAAGFASAAWSVGKLGLTG